MPGFFLFSRLKGPLPCCLFFLLCCGVASAFALLLVVWEGQWSAPLPKYRHIGRMANVIKRSAMGGVGVCGVVGGVCVGRV